MGIGFVPVFLNYYNKTNEDKNEALQWSTKIRISQ